MKWGGLTPVLQYSILFALFHQILDVEGASFDRKLRICILYSYGGEVCYSLTSRYFFKEMGVWDCLVVRLPRIVARSVVIM